MKKRSTSSAGISRRQGLKLIAGAALVPPFAARADAATPEVLAFDALYSSRSVLGLEYSERVKSLDGQKVRMRGYMAPPLKADATFFVLTRTPVALCPFCSSDADWPDDIVVVYLAAHQNFVQFNRAIEVEGTLAHGSWTDPETGFVSMLRITQSRFGQV